MKYFLSKHNNLISVLNDVVKLVEIDSESQSYKDYIKYLEEGNTVEPSDYESDEERIEISRENIIKRYEGYEIDGKNAYQLFRADLINDIYSGKITETQAFIIEQYLSKGYDKISANGDWKTAHYLLSNMTVSSSHNFVNEYLQKAIAIMSDYISKNY